MSTFSILNTSRNTQVASQAVLADSFISRMVGLLKHSSLKEGEALVITRCNSIHMFFMKFAIDVIFVDGNNRVVGLVERIKPNRLSPIFFKAKCAIEIPEGGIAESQTAVGDIIQMGNA